MGKKKNFRKVPKKLLRRLEEVQGDFVEVGVTSRITLREVILGDWEHLGIKFDNDTLIVPSEQTPASGNGVTSKVNVEGRVVVRKDLPKEWKTYDVDVPSWGGGTHTVYWDREVYQRDNIPPYLTRLEMLVLNEEKGDEPAFLIKFRLLDVLDKNDFDFEKDLLFMINLLQENVGNADIFKANAKDLEYLKTQYVDWEIFPTGEKEQTISKFANNKKKITKSLMSRIEERYDFLMEFEPTAFIRGSNGFKNYFGAKFGDDFVVFENIDYGNAVYILQDDWEELSKLSRVELMKKFKGQHDRITHTKGWKSKLKEKIVNLKGSDL